MREIIIDTETTGLDPLSGDRVVEIGAVEVLNAIPTGTTFHRYLNPDRDMPDAAYRVHGLSSAFLADKLRFAEVADDLAAFLGGDRIVAHNAAFDVAFLNAEFGRCGRQGIPGHLVVDSLALAKRKHSGHNSLDALCSRYGIDLSRRIKHGALLDAELLAEVYLELCGGRQAAFVLADDGGGGAAQPGAIRHRPRPSPLAQRLGEAERAAHAAFMATFESSIWARIWSAPGAGSGAEAVLAATVTAGITVVAQTAAPVPDAVGAALDADADLVLVAAE